MERTHPSELLRGDGACVPRSTNERNTVIFFLQKPRKPPIYAIMQQHRPNAHPWWRVSVMHHHKGGVPSASTTPMVSTAADLRRGVAGL